MNESLMRDLHDTQIEELTAVKTAIAELAKKPTATPTDIAKLQMIIANIRIPEQDNTHIAEVLRHIQMLSKQTAGETGNQIKWLQSIHEYAKSLSEKSNSNSEMMVRGIEMLKSTKETLHSKILDYKFTLFALALWGAVMSAFCANCLYDQRSMRDQLSELRENSLKYRYIKMKGEATPKRIAEIEDVFVYNRNYDKIIEMQNNVNAFEEAVAKKAIADEQARLNRLEAERQEETALELIKR